MKFFMSDKVFTFMAKHHNHKLPHHFWQKPVSARSGAQNTPIKREAGEKLKTNEYIQVCLFVLCRRVVDGYHSIFQVGTTVRLLRDFLSYSTRSFQAVSHPSTILARRRFPLSYEWQLKEQLRVSRRIQPLSAPTILNFLDRTNGSSKGK